MVGVVETAPPRDLASLVRWIGGTNPRPRRSRRGAGTARVAARDRREAVHLYLDVSGSVEGLLDRLHTDAPVSDLAGGTCQSTGGTSLVPVVHHIREHGVRRAVIVTDGEVGSLNAADRETLRETALGVALTNPAARHGQLARLSRHVVVLPGLEADGVSSTFYALRPRRV